jgi:hypothetical protein
MVSHSSELGYLPTTCQLLRFAEGYGSSPLERKAGHLDSGGLTAFEALRLHSLRYKSASEPLMWGQSLKLTRWIHRQ